MNTLYIAQTTWDDFTPEAQEQLADFMVYTYLIIWIICAIVLIWAVVSIIKISNQMVILNKQIQDQRTESEQDFNRLIKVILQISGHAPTDPDPTPLTTSQSPQRRKRGEPLHR